MSSLKQRELFQKKKWFEMNSSVLFIYQIVLLIYLFDAQGLLTLICHYKNRIFLYTETRKEH